LSRYNPVTNEGDVLHIKLKTAGGLRGLSPIEIARQSIGLGLAAEKQGSRFYGRGQTLSGLIEFEPTATQDNVDLTKANWKRRHAGTDRSFEPGILVGAKWKPISVTPEEAQFLQTRAFQVEDIASRIYGIPPHLVGLTEKQTSWGTGVEQQGIGLYRFTLKGHLTRFETAMSQLLPRGQFLRLNHRALVEADSKTEAEILQTQLQNGVINPNHWRAILDEPPRPGGDRYMVPMNMQILEANGKPPEKAPPPDFGTPAPNGNGQKPVEVTQP
jgi:HK97 family phage portal protein